MEKIPEDGFYSRRAGQGINPAAELASAPLCDKEPEKHCQIPSKWPPAGYWCTCFWPNCQKQTPWGWPEGTLSSRGTWAHSPAQCSSIGIFMSEPQNWVTIALMPLTGPLVPLTKIQLSAYGMLCISAMLVQCCQVPPQTGKELVDALMLHCITTKANTTRFWTQ